VADTARTSERVEQQIAVLKDVSGGVLREAANLSGQMQDHGAALARAAEDLASAQSRVDAALVNKQADIEQLINTIEQRGHEMEAVMQSFNGLLNESLNAAEQRARDVSTTLLGSSESASAAIKDQYDMIRTLSSKERDRTASALRASHEQTLGEMQQVISESTERFRETAEQLRGLTAEVAQELEATRAEVTRGVAAMPRDLKAQTGAIKRAVGDQIKALDELNALVDRTGMDVVAASAAPRSERPVPGRLVTPAPVTRAVAPVPRAPAVRPAPAASSNRSNGGWLSDLLSKASDDDSDKARASTRSRPTEQGLEALDVISSDIARLVDGEALSDAWDRVTAGERHAFTRRLYTLQGQQTFDEVRRRYRREADFRGTVDRYVEEFERLLKEVATEDRDGAIARSYLVSDTGKVYTLLAHAAERFE
jgi:hypothetical protein